MAFHLGKLAFSTLLKEKKAFNVNCISFNVDYFCSKLISLFILFLSVYISQPKSFQELFHLGPYVGLKM